MLTFSNVPLQFALSDSLWLSLAHSGSLSLAHSRTFWLTLTQCGSLWLSQVLIISQRLGRIATVYPTLLRRRLLSPLKCERQSRAGTRRFDGISVEGSEGGQWNFPLFPLFVSTSSRRWSLVTTNSATLMVSLVEGSEGSAVENQCARNLENKQ